MQDAFDEFDDLEFSEPISVSQGSFKPSQSQPSSSQSSTKSEQVCMEFLLILLLNNYVIIFCSYQKTKYLARNISIHRSFWCFCPSFSLCLRCVINPAVAPVLMLTWLATTGAVPVCTSKPSAITITLLRLRFKRKSNYANIEKFIIIVAVFIFDRTWQTCDQLFIGCLSLYYWDACGKGLVHFEEKNIESTALGLGLLHSDASFISL